MAGLTASEPSSAWVVSWCEQELSFAVRCGLKVAG